MHVGGWGALTEHHRWEERDTVLEAAESKIRVLADSVHGESVRGLYMAPSCCVLKGTFFRYVDSSSSYRDTSPIGLEPHPDDLL